MADEETDHSDASTYTSSLEENEDDGGSTNSDPSTYPSSLEQNEDVGGGKNSDSSTAASPVQQNDDVGGSTNSDSSTSGSPVQQNEDVEGSTDSDSPSSSSAEQQNEDVGGTTNSDSSSSSSPVQQKEDVEDQVVAVARRSGPAQSCYVLTGFSQNRHANRHSPIARPVQGTTVARRRDFFQSSDLTPLQVLAETAASFQYLPQTDGSFQTLSPTLAPLPSPFQTDHPGSHLAKETPLGISQGLDRTRPPSKPKCFLCKKDLSLTPEGFQPASPPAVDGLPCGHHFHNQCLKLATPADQSDTRACIVCHRPNN